MCISIMHPPLRSGGTKHNYAKKPDIDDDDNFEVSESDYYDDCNDSEVGKSDCYDDDQTIRRRGRLLIRYNGVNKLPMMLIRCQ